MSKQILKIIVITSLMLLGVIACKDENPEENPAKPKLTAKELIGAEQAYPNEKKEVVEVTVKGAKLTCEKVNGKYFYQGDILLDVVNKTPKAIQHRAGIDIPYMRWKNNVFIYKIDPDFPKKERITEAFKLFKNTNIVFKERTNEENYALFKYIPNAGCYSWIGMTNEGAQEIVIDNWGEAGTVAHEICHALGILHEQMRPDRDKYIKIHYDNIIDSMEDNFKTAPAEWNPVALGEFDFGSVMLYNSFGWYDVALDIDKPIMSKLDNTTFKAQRVKLSKGDEEIINYLYPKIYDLGVDKDNITLKEKQTESLNITDGSGNYIITSSDESKATATLKDNIITINAVAEGNTVITIKDVKAEQEKNIQVTVEKQSYIEFTTNKNIGEIIKLQMYADEKDQVNVWIDLNNNKKKDSGEEVTEFSDDVWSNFISYKIGSQTIRIYGEVSFFITESKWEDYKSKGQQITYLDVSHNNTLKYLYCGGNNLTNLDVSQNIGLETLLCNDNELTNLDVSQNSSLVELRCYNNKLTSLNVSNNKDLSLLSCYRNQLTDLNVSSNTNITYLRVGENQLTDLDVTQNSNLKTLWCVNNQLTSLDVSQNSKLKKLVCFGNQLTSLDVSQNSKLKILDCYTNQLKTLDVSKNINLEHLSVHVNKLTNLDVSKNINLKSLTCYYNELTSLDISKNTKLYGLECSSNKITCIKVNQSQLDNIPNDWEKDDTATYSTSCN